MSRALAHSCKFDDDVSVIGNDMLLGWISRLLSDIVAAFGVIVYGIFVKVDVKGIST